MPINRHPPITRSQRGLHPDLTENGDLRPEAYMYPDAEERDWNRKFAEDQGFAGSFMDRVTAWQARRPTYVQEQVAGRIFGEGRGPYAGFREYAQEVERLEREEDQYTYGHGTIVVRDHEIADMGLSQFEKLFDERGQPRPGVVFERTNRSVRLDDGVDPFSARELRSNRP
jgi:hypothetical protein